MRVLLCVFFFFKQKTAYEILRSDWSSDVCSSDLAALGLLAAAPAAHAADAAAGEKTFAKCKSCHMIEGGGETIVRGGKVGPNLYGIVGRQAGSVEDYRYGDSLVE